MTGNRSGHPAAETLAKRRALEAHARYSLDRREQVDRSENGPPAIARPLHERETFQPFRAVKRRSVTPVQYLFDRQPQQFQPVPQTSNGDHLRGLGQPLASDQPAGRLTQAPEAHGIEARHDQPALGSQYTVDFAQDLVRLVGKLEHMGQHHQIERLGGKWKMAEVVDQKRRTRRKREQRT